MAVPFLSEMQSQQNHKDRKEELGCQELWEWWGNSIACLIVIWFLFGMTNKTGSRKWGWLHDIVNKLKSWIAHFKWLKWWVSCNMNFVLIFKRCFKMTYINAHMCLVTQLWNFKIFFLYIVDVCWLFHSKSFISWSIFGEIWAVDLCNWWFKYLVYLMLQTSIKQEKYDLGNQSRR